ncbi:helix-turn-helix domain-containing protein [Nocardia sp. NPDC058176]|uniref:helix-turn-helix domain-containing protein n=1 Tax=Nocardia sp. NPDC058176 TaxID=3346368 RepID=UPI0036D93E20
MRPAEIAATRHLMGLSQAELAAALEVNRHAVKDWESGRFQPRSGVVRDLLTLRAEHDAELATLVEQTSENEVEVPDGPRPRGWYLALAARLMDRVPSARIDWPSA